MKTYYMPLAFCVMLAANVRAHDTFLKLESHFVPVGQKMAIRLMNGTFEVSENSIALNRMRDVRLTGPNGFHLRPEERQWELTDKLNRLELAVGKSGTYGLGVSTKPRSLSMTAEQFNRYLEHDGVLDVLKMRRDRRELDRPVKEKYSKHVKALVQVGDQQTDNFKDVYGYPIEIVPQKNPFAMKMGEQLPVLILFQGEPVKNQLVFASSDGFHEHDAQGKHVEAVKTRTDAKGMAKIKLSSHGRWYIRLIHMVPSNEADVDYESNWATLTFEVK